MVECSQQEKKRRSRKIRTRTAASSQTNTKSENCNGKGKKPKKNKKKKKLYVKNLNSNNNNKTITSANTGIKWVPEERTEKCLPHTLMGDRAMDRVISLLRQSASRSIYIVDSTMVSIIALMRRNPQWYKIRDKFGALELSQQPDGIYLFPAFTGDHHFGHWHTTVLKNMVTYGWGGT